MQKKKLFHENTKNFVFRCNDKKKEYTVLAKKNSMPVENSLLKLPWTFFFETWAYINQGT
jgi:hypothetical protein